MADTAELKVNPDVYTRLRDAWIAQPQWNSDLLMAASAVFALLLFINSFQQQQWQKKLPPGPRPWPLLGNFPSLTSRPHRGLQKIARKFGGLTILRLGAHPCILVSTADVAKEIFRNHDATFSSRPNGLTFEIFTENKSLVQSPYGPYWRSLRRLCTSELFSPKRLASYERGRTEEIRTMAMILRTQSQKGEVINLKQWLLYVTSNNMTRMVVNKRYFGSDGANQQEALEFQHLVSLVSDTGSAFIISDFFPNLRFITKLQGWEKRILYMKRVAYEICGRMIGLEDRRQKLKEGVVDKDYVPDFVDVLMAARSGEEPLSDYAIMVVVLDIILAGTESSATSSEWAITELVRQPDAMRRAQDEIASVVGPNRMVQESDIPNLPYLQAIVKENFRVHPPATLSVPRAANREAEILEYKFPAQTRLILNIYSIHRDPSVYEKPEEFLPERFLEHPEVIATSGSDYYQLIPFGVGRRMCPGFALGNLMVHLMLAHLIHSFDWSVPPGEELDMSEAKGVTGTRAVPLSLIAKPRAPAFLY